MAESIQSKTRAGGPSSDVAVLVDPRVWDHTAYQCKQWKVVAMGLLSPEVDLHWLVAGKTLKTSGFDLWGVQPAAS
ncbi:hypothetical protein OOU_Y34scaffold00592g22 [Pyricularia oryzae Y34]|uniref:Uncharacterized protein n=2 Tax=Pyricularia oryzae TaxID=318829 RepID=A0AA97PK46_PYRO3|nr:hypothetical protein OOU_Y34scaffold00592g22 [Pyricularia oryzae Y34]